MRVWQTIHSPVLLRHSHDAAYAAVVLSGGYEEAGDQGRFRVEAGEVILHDRFEAHLNRLPGSMAVVLNLPLPPGLSFAPGAARVTDPDAIVRRAERDRAGAVDLLLLTLRARRSIHGGWPDELAATLIEDPCLVLTTWAEQQRLAPWSVSRGFADVFGVSPEAFRARARARRAWKAIQTTAAPLAQIAFESGFADQSHMSRSVKQLTGDVPFVWRHAANGFKTRAPSVR